MGVYASHIEQLFGVLQRAADAFRQAGIEYRVVGGMAVFFHVDARDPVAARFTRDIDFAVRRVDIDKIRETLRPFGFTYRYVAGVDILLLETEPKASTAIHLVFLLEKVRPEYSEPVPDSPPVTDLVEGVALASVLDLVIMKLTSFREKDRVHIRDMDSVGLITSKIEEQLPEPLKERLHTVRATE